MSVYQAQVEQDEDGRWSSWIEELPGCAAWGHSRQEALVSLADAATAYVADMIVAGQMPPNEGDVVIREPMPTQ